MTGDATDRRLAAAATIGDLREVARRRVPRAVFDYTDGAAGAEISLRRSREAFERVEFRPSVLRDVSAVDPSTSLLGAPSALPLAFAPTGFTRLMHTEETPSAGWPSGPSPRAVDHGHHLARGAGDGGPGARRWFQLYLEGPGGQRRSSSGPVAGYEALVLTVDTPVAGPRLRDVRNGFTIPGAHRADGRQRRRPSAVVGGPADDTAARVRLAALLGRHGRRAGGPRLRAGRDGRRRPALRETWRGR